MIHFLYLPAKPVPLSAVTTRVQGADYASRFTPLETNIIEQHWNALSKKNPKVFSKPNGLGTLTSTQGTTFTFQPTEFKTYAGITAHPLRKGMMAGMRVSCVGGVVHLKDGSCILRNRPIDVSHPGKIDASFSGFAAVENDTIVIEKAIHAKLARELNITPKDIITLQLTGVHEETEEDYSCMFDVIVDVRLTKDELNLDAKQYFFLKQTEVPSFIKANKKTLLPDGRATLFASLPSALR